jgi:hypothetical protein
MSLEARIITYHGGFSTDNRSIHQKTTILRRVNIITIGSCERRANALFGGIVMDQTGD